jgi:hypothetical protein
MYKTKAISYETRAKTFWSLMAIILVCLVVYMYSVNATIHNTVARVDLEQQTTTLSAHIGEMEFSYIGLKNNVSLEMAYARGFQNVVSPIYISRSSGRALSMNTKR